jgi:hypothetical protein
MAFHPGRSLSRGKLGVFALLLGCALLVTIGLLPAFTLGLHLGSRQLPKREVITTPEIMIWQQDCPEVAAEPGETVQKL